MKNTTSTTSTNNRNLRNESIKHLGFVKENKLWYADLPEFLALGLGNKNNLLMVDGADTFLDFLSNNDTKITLAISTESFEGFEGELSKIKIGLNQDLLDAVGHAPVNYGAYYNVITWKGQSHPHRLWLCPVAEWVFGNYPDKIFIQIVQ